MSEPTPPREWSIQDVARLAGTTSRTLRHYGDVGLLPATRIGANGYRFYDAASLTRLQRILLLRELGLGISAIREVFEGQQDDERALRTHLGALEREQQRLDRQIASVERTLTKLNEGAQLVAEEMFDGFDHTQYRDEVEERWGADAFQLSDAWWRAMSKDEQRKFQAQHRQIAADYAAAQEDGVAATDSRVQAIVARHVDWLNLSAGATGAEITPTRLRGYADMYVGDPRFAANYGGANGAEYVRNAFVQYAESL